MAALIAVALSACASTIEAVEEAVGFERESPSRDAAALPQTDDTETAEQLIDPPLPSDKPAAPGDKPASPGVTADFLMGSDELQVADILGQPLRKEHRPPAVAWVYERNGCRLDLMFYPDMESERWIALAYRTQADEGGPCPDGTTFAEVRLDDG